LAAIYAFASSLWVLWFMALFIGICAWAFWPARRRDMEEHGRIPLRNGEIGNDHADKD
jgi:cytochrome c oxidase cbb3-type subunit IV